MDPITVGTPESGKSIQQALANVRASLEQGQREGRPNAMLALAELTLLEANLPAGAAEAEAGGYADAWVLEELKAAVARNLASR